MRKRPIKVKLQKTLNGDFRVARLTNAINVEASACYGDVLKFSVGSVLNETEADIVCAASGLDVTVHDCSH